MPSTLLFLTLVGRTPERYRNSRRVSGGLRAARRETAGSRAPKGSPKLAPFMLDATTVRRQRRAATSSDELQSAAWGGGRLRDPAGRKNSAKSPPKSVKFGLSPIPPRRSAPGRQGRRFEEPRYSLSAYSSSPPAESSNELRRVAARRVGWRRTARLKEPQAYNPIHHLKLSVSACRPLPRGAPRLGDKAGGSKSHKSITYFY